MKTRIFIIEDSEIVQHLLKHTLNDSFDCEIEIVNSAKSLLKEVVDFQPDIIVLDYNLKINNVVIDANEMLIHLKKNLPFASIIIFSGQRDLNVAISLLNNGAVNYVSKDSQNFHLEIIKSVKEIIILKESGNELKKYRSNIKANFMWFMILVFISITTSVISLKLFN